MDLTHPYRSPLSGMTLASDGEAVVGLWFDGQRHFAQTLSPSHAEKDLPIFLEAERWLDRYFRGEDPGVPPPLRMRGTAFRRLVWELPPGTRTRPERSCGVSGRDALWGTSSLFAVNPRDQAIHHPYPYAGGDGRY